MLNESLLTSESFLIEDAMYLSQPHNTTRQSLAPKPLFSTNEQKFFSDIIAQRLPSESSDPSQTTNSRISNLCGDINTILYSCISLIHPNQKRVKRTFFETPKKTPQPSPPTSPNVFSELPNKPYPPLSPGPHPNFTTPKKRPRRSNLEIDVHRTHTCPHPGCFKSYASKKALYIHTKRLHTIQPNQLNSEPDTDHPPRPQAKYLLSNPNTRPRWGVDINRVLKNKTKLLDSLERLADISTHCTSIYSKELRFAQNESDHKSRQLADRENLSDCGELGRGLGRKSTRGVGDDIFS